MSLKMRNMDMSKAMYNPENTEMTHDMSNSLPFQASPKHNVNQKNLIEWMGFGRALNLLKEGLPLQRNGWNGKDMYICLQRPDGGSKMTLPYIYMRTAQGDLVPWLASQTDILAEDWRLW